jgi:hypothetical protein
MKGWLLPNDNFQYIRGRQAGPIANHARYWRIYCLFLVQHLRNGHKRTNKTLF